MKWESTERPHDTTPMRRDVTSNVIQNGETS